MIKTDADDYVKPEDRVRMRIDEMLTRAGWVVQDHQAIHPYARAGVAVRELVTNARRQPGVRPTQRPP